MYGLRKDIRRGGEIMSEEMVIFLVNKITALELRVNELEVQITKLNDERCSRLFAGMGPL